MPHDCDVARTAATLRLRDDSIRCRLGRAEAPVGRPLCSPRTVASLHVPLARTAVAD